MAKDVQLLELLAPQAAISIRNARLYQELESRIQAQRLAEAASWSWLSMGCL